MLNKKIVGIIPARFKSSRFEGKPLADISGKPMIWWVYEQAKKVHEFSDVIVATEDKRIMEVCYKLGINAMITSDKHKTGTDRVGEIAKKIPADLYVNIQGDEPLLEPKTILSAVKPFFEKKDLQVSNLMSKITDPTDLINVTVPKVVVNKDNFGIFLSRAAIPYPKGSLNGPYYKQVCVYGIKPAALDFFVSSKRGIIEEVEDIEILRFIEAGYKVYYSEVITNSIAVDTPSDLEKVKAFLNKKNFFI